MADAYLASTLVMGLLAVGVVVLVLRARRWNHYSPRTSYGSLDAGGEPTTGFGKLVSAERTWTVAYLLLAVGFVAGTIVYLSGLSAAVSGPAMLAALGVAILVYLVGGIYVALREHGRPSAQAAAGSAVTVGMLFVVAITARLVMGG